MDNMELIFGRLWHLKDIPGQEYIIWPMDSDFAIAQTNSLDAALEMSGGDLATIEVLVRTDGGRNAFTFPSA